MTLRTWYFYKPETGEFLDRRYGAPDAHDLALNTPAGYVAIEGRFDPRSQRVEQGVVVDWQPPKPSDDHEWDTETRRWVLTAEARQKTAARAAAMTDILALEASTQRALREAALGMPGAQERLQNVDQRVAELRKLL